MFFSRGCYLERTDSNSAVNETGTWRKDSTEKYVYIIHHKSLGNSAKNNIFSRILNLIFNLMK
jgi:hypothetical protein